jgi:hypothetical protein
MKAEDIIAVLDEQRARLVKLEGEEISGFVVVVPPTGEPTRLLLMGETDEVGFWGYVVDQLKLKQGPKPPVYGGVAVLRHPAVDGDPRALHRRAVRRADDQLHALHPPHAQRRRRLDGDQMGAAAGRARPEPELRRRGSLGPAVAHHHASAEE